MLFVLLASNGSPSVLMRSRVKWWRAWLACAVASLLERDAWRSAPCLAALPGAEFWTHFERRYGHNPDLAPDSVKEYIEPLLRADFRLLETFEPRRKDRLT